MTNLNWTDAHIAMQARWPELPESTIREMVAEAEATEQGEDESPIEGVDYYVSHEHQPWVRGAVYAYGWTADDREWGRNFVCEAVARAWARERGATVTGVLPLEAVPARDRAAEAADTGRALDAQFTAIRGRK